MDRSHLVVEWQLKHLPFSVTNHEIGVTGKVNRSVIMTRYASKIEKMFNEDLTVRKTSRELTYIEEEEEEKLQEIEDTTTLKNPPSTPTTAEKDNITIVNVENEIGEKKEEREEQEEISKEVTDRHVRFQEEIDFKDKDPVNEKTS